MYSATIGKRRYSFGDLETLLAKASPTRSGISKVLNAEMTLGAKLVRVVPK